MLDNKFTMSDEENLKDSCVTSANHIEKNGKEESISIKKTNQSKKSLTAKNQRNLRNLPYTINRYSLSCQVCHTKFKQFKELQNHMPEHYPEQIRHLYGKLFAHEFHLKLHQKSHLDKDLKCDYCGQIFKT